MRQNSASATLVMILIALALGAPALVRPQTGDFERGVAEFQAGNYAAAFDVFARSETLAPGTTDALLYEGKCLIHLQDFAGAEKALRGYLGAHSDSADALYLLGFVLHRENRPAESLDIYTRAAAHSRPTSDDLKIVGLDYVLLNDYVDAIRWLERAVEFDPKNKDAWYYLGRAYYTRARLAEARKAFRSVLDLDPHSVKAENNVGLLFETEGQPAAAMEAYRNAIAWQEQNPHLNEQPYVNLGNLLMEQGQMSDAAGPLEKAAKLAPNNAYCRLTLGVYLLKSGQLERAQQELEAATRLDPNNAAAHYQLGRLYKQTHQLDRAKAEFERTAQLQSRAVGSQTAAPDH
jgi:tetratricopeptide (TPR) repeat protein